jgi:hypothetical protein
VCARSLKALLCRLGRWVVCMVFSSCIPHDEAVLLQLIMIFGVCAHFDLQYAWMDGSVTCDSF